MVRNMIKIALPFPPSSNGCYKSFAKGRKIFRAKTTKYNDWIKNAPDFEDLKVDGQVHVSYLMYFPDNRVRDGQSYLKPSLDYLVKQKILTDDNRRIVKGEQWIDMGNDKGNPRIEVIIKEVDAIWKTMTKALIFMAEQWQPNTQKK